MSSGVIFRAPRVMIAIGLIVTFMGNASASPNTLTVQDPRPVAKAIQELDKRYGWQITYEDPPYSRYSDMPDVTPSVQEGSSVVPGASHVTVPNAAILSFPLPATNQDELTSVNAVVKIYNESHRGFAFAVMQGAGPSRRAPANDRLSRKPRAGDAGIGRGDHDRAKGANCRRVPRRDLQESFHRYQYTSRDGHCLAKYVTSDEDLHRRIRNGAIDFRTMDSRAPRRLFMAVIVFSP
jgi:hypothetical protein